MSGTMGFLFSLLAVVATGFAGCGLYLMAHLCIKLTRGGGEDE